VRKLENLNVEDLMRMTIKEGASDLHLTVGCPPALRIDGQLRFLTALPVLKPADTLEFLKTLLTQEQMERLDKERDLDFPYAIPGVSRFRINAYHQRGCHAIAIRTIPKDVPTIEELGLPSTLKGLALRPRGLVLVTGPTGVGKTTTLASMVKEVNRSKCIHIVTVEDPIEYLHAHERSIVNQRELGTDVKTFASGLRSALREDPDVIMVGEMRDLETTTTALTAAETGHLVMASMHTRDAASTVDRVIDQFPSYQQQQIRTMLSVTLEAVISQQLLVRRGGKGRVAALEIMIATPAVRNLIREGKTHMIPNVIQTSTRFGMQTMDQALKDLCLHGIITYEEAMSHAFNPDELAKLLAS